MSLARLVITAVTVEGRSKSEVALKHQQDRLTDQIHSSPTRNASSSSDRTD
jgi:hypothetical protein